MRLSCAGCRGVGVVLYQASGRVAIAGDYEVQTCGLTGMTGRGAQGRTRSVSLRPHGGPRLYEYPSQRGRQVRVGDSPRGAA
jgi:hypothetical protein